MTKEDFQNTNRCSYCMNDPKSHSFSCFQSNINGYHLYKTVVAESILYNKPDTIIHHIEHDPYLNKDIQWNWIVDLTNASRKHYMALNTVREISKWIKREKDNKCKELQEIKIVGGSPILTIPLILLAKMFLPSHIKIVHGCN